MENTDDLKGKSFDSINSILANSLDSNALLSTCLDVLIAVHNDGKTEEEKAAYFKKINEKLAEHRKANLNLIPVKSNIMNDLISTIAICVQAAGSIALFIIIQRQNRFFKTQINVQEGIINSMKTYSSLIDVEELKKFVDLSKQTMRMETDKEKVELQTKVNEVEKELKEKTSSHNVKYESIVVAFGLLIVRTLTRERRQIYINNYPDHKKDLVSIVNKFEMYIESEGKDLSLESKLDVALKQTEKALDMLSPKIVSAVINP